MFADFLCRSVISTTGASNYVQGQFELIEMGETACRLEASSLPHHAADTDRRRVSVQLLPTTIPSLSPVLGTHHRRSPVIGWPSASASA